MQPKLLVQQQIDSTLPRRHQLRWRIILAFMAVALISIIGVVALILFIWADQSVEQSYNQLESVAELKQNQIQRWLNDSQMALQILIAEPFADDIEEVLDATTNLAAQERLNQIFQQLISVGSDVEQTNLRFESLFMYTPDGTVVASSNERQIGQVVRTQPFFDESLSSAFIQPPYYRVGEDNLTMIVTYPLRDENNNVEAIIAGDLDLQVLAEIMQERSGLGNSGETYLVSQESNYLLTPSRFEGYEMNRSYRSQGIDQSLQGFDGRGIYDDYRSPPSEVIGVYRWIPELQAGLLAEIDEAEAFTGLTEGRTISLAFTSLMILLVAIIGLYTARWISKPIQALTQTAVAVAKGDLAQRVQMKSSNEIGVLARVFNRMTTELQHAQESLEQRVAERTKELQQTLNEREDLLQDLQESLSERQRLQSTIQGLSMPVIPLLTDIIVMPLVGEVDQQRSNMMIDALLAGIGQQRAKIALIDLTGVPLIDSQAVETLVTMRRSAELLGTAVIFVGIHPEIAQTLLSLNVDVSDLQTCSDLRAGIKFALRLLNRQS